jgi:thiol-disulfide isomerase/thioredoxin
MDCPHCKKIEPVVNLFEKKFGEIVKLEMWHDDKNKRLFDSLAKKRCNGVPFFINTENGKFVCGECTIEQLEDLVT